MINHYNKLWLTLVPAVAVIRGEQALFGIIGRKGYVDGFINFILKTRAKTFEKYIILWN